MLRTLRIIFAILSLLAVTALFVDVTGYAASHWAWMASIQLVPAVLALNLVVVAAIVAATLLFGRIYCSLVCPLGIFQDVINRVSIMCSGRKRRKLGKFGYMPARTLIRLFVLAAFILLLAIGTIAAVCTWTASFVEPYSAYGRMATWLLRPIAVLANNAAADVAAEHGSYVFASVVPMAVSVPLLSVAVVTFVVITLFAWTSGRDYCNTICPVGTVLGWMSRRSLLRINIDADKCTACGQCERHCKSSCIDSKSHSVDTSRCVACMDCLGACNRDAIRYSVVKPQPQPAPAETSKTDSTRRAFLVGGTIIAADLAASALGSQGDGGFAPLKKKKSPARVTPLVPPGAKSLRDLASKCTACQLCISNCPNSVLSPSTELSSFMQPVMDYSAGYCRPECTTCSDVCPADAILPIDVATKSSTKIGTAVVDRAICIAAYGQKCGKCADSCPAAAIEMVEVTPGRPQPVVDESACIGCGSCEYHCPVGTVASNRSDRAAIHVEGVDTHYTI